MFLNNINKQINNDPSSFIFSGYMYKFLVVEVVSRGLIHSSIVEKIKIFLNKLDTYFQI